jgi:hypothetical protein
MFDDLRKEFLEWVGFGSGRDPRAMLEAAPHEVVEALSAAGVPRLSEFAKLEEMRRAHVIADWSITRSLTVGGAGQQFLSFPVSITTVNHIERITLEMHTAQKFEPGEA